MRGIDLKIRYDSVKPHYRFVLGCLTGELLVLRSSIATEGLSSTDELRADLVHYLYVRLSTRFIYGVQIQQHNANVTPVRYRISDLADTRCLDEQVFFDVDTNEIDSFFFF